MKIGIVGAGYVGLSTALSLCSMGHLVRLYDTDKDRIDILNKGQTPFYEEGIQDAINVCFAKKTISFHHIFEEFIDDLDVLFICISTSVNSKGEIEKYNFERLIDELTPFHDKGITLGIKTTITPDMYYFLKNRLSGTKFRIAINPEFLREGSALKDALNPSRIVIGTEDENSRKVLEKIYKNYDCPKIFTDPISAIIIKYASNSFLSVKISFINEIARLCDVLNCDIEDVAKGIGLDPRIGKEYLRAGIGFGGTCLPKDLMVLIKFACENKVKLNILESAKRVNDEQYNIVISKLKSSIGDLRNKTIGILGLSFKGGTDDIRDSVSIKIIRKLQEEGSIIKAHDFLSVDSAKKILSNVLCSSDIFLVSEGSDALVIATDWPQYAALDWKKIYATMKGNLIIDGRNILNPEIMKALGFTYIGIGRK